ncbi:ATPase [Pyrococcus kukulkanii]|uniref:ATPase n=1 Tax=Pyrococcus kukulkanii TaxID=1609559 RepID=A0A127B934_9EURY|nr:ATPase [Pyrococcus kukulkanii]AMM53788.1 ATPase [Pyrococcus kukulkanii]
MRIIPRRIEVEKVRSPGWKMIYGRRKTGKTFLVEKFTKWDKFYFVKRDGSIFDKQTATSMTYREFISGLLQDLRESRRVVIDEFHRLPDEFLDFLHAYSGTGDLILITSTLWLATRLIARRESPLLGIAEPIKVGLIDERELLVELEKEVNGKELIEAATYLREPILVPIYRPPLRRFLAEYLASSGAIVEEIVGEAFREEEVTMSRVYLAILSAVADGMQKSGEITSVLMNKGLIESPSAVQKYLKILTAMGFLEKIPIYGKKRFRYRISSPLLDLHFYLEEKYSYTELETPVEFIVKVIEMKLPLHVQYFVENLLSKVYGLRKTKIEEPKLEVDIALLRFSRLEIVGEVKWKSRVKEEEIRKIEEKLQKFKCRKVLFVPSLDVLEREPKNVEVLTPEDLVRLARKSLPPMVNR